MLQKKKEKKMWRYLNSKDEKAVEAKIIDNDNDTDLNGVSDQMYILFQCI